MVNAKIHLKRVLSLPVVVLSVVPLPLQSRELTDFPMCGDVKRQLPAIYMCSTSCVGRQNCPIRVSNNPLSRIPEAIARSLSTSFIKLGKGLIPLGKESWIEWRDVRPDAGASTERLAKAAV